MAARLGSTFPNQTFNASWIAGVRVKANSLHSGKRKTTARFSPVFLKGKPWALLSHLQFETKTLGLKITARSHANFDRHTPIILTRRNTEFETGTAGVERLRAKRSDASRRAPLPKRS